MYPTENVNIFYKEEKFLSTEFKVILTETKLLLLTTGVDDDRILEGTRKDRFFNMLDEIGKKYTPSKTTGVSLFFYIT